MLALSVRQPFAELILRGLKAVEYRSRPTKVIGRRFWLYASRTPAKPDRTAGGNAWSLDLAMATGRNAAPPWMLELAEGLLLGELPRGVIVGSAVIDRVSPGAGASEGLWHWHLADVRREKTLRKPQRHPQPVWFEPFDFDADDAAADQRG